MVVVACGGSSDLCKVGRAITTRYYRYMLLPLHASPSPCARSAQHAAAGTAHRDCGSLRAHTVIAAHGLACERALGRSTDARARGR